MKDASEDEQAEDFINEARFSSKPARSKSEREEQLRMMMDEEGRRVNAGADRLS